MAAEKRFSERANAFGEIDYLLVDEELFERERHGPSPDEKERDLPWGSKRRAPTGTGLERVER